MKHVLKWKLQNYDKSGTIIENAEQKKLQAIFLMVKDEIMETYNHWENNEFVSMLHEREQSYLSGTSKIYTAAESASRAREALKLQNK